MEKKILPVEQLRRIAAPVALTLGLTVLGACTETEPVSNATATTETNKTEANNNGEQQATPEAKQAEVKKQLVNIFEEVYTGDLAADSVERAPADEYSQVSYFEASATLGDKVLTVSLEAPGSGFEPQLDSASFVSLKLSDTSNGGEPTVDNPNGSYEIAKVAYTDQEHGVARIVGIGDNGQFYTGNLEGDSLMSQLGATQEAIDYIEASFDQTK